MARFTTGGMYLDFGQDEGAQQVRAFVSEK
jgi:hypothetical protein